MVLAVLVLHGATDFVGSLERRDDNFASTSTSTSTSSQPLERIAIIAIKDQSIANIGRWSWSCDVHAQRFDPLATANAKRLPKKQSSARYLLTLRQAMPKKI